MNSPIVRDALAELIPCSCVAQVNTDRNPMAGTETQAHDAMLHPPSSPSPPGHHSLSGQRMDPMWRGKEETNAQECGKAPLLSGRGDTAMGT